MTIVYMHWIRTYQVERDLYIRICHLGLCFIHREDRDGKWKRLLTANYQDETHTGREWKGKAIAVAYKAP